MTMLRELLSVEESSKLTELAYSEPFPWQSAVDRRQEGRTPTERMRPTSPASALAAAVSHRLAADAHHVDRRTRRFAKIESWIISKESTLRCRIWDCPEADIQLRLLSAERAARRRGQLAESARLAQFYRRAGGRMSAGLVS